MSTFLIRILSTSLTSVSISLSAVTLGIYLGEAGRANGAGKNRAWRNRTGRNRAGTNRADRNHAEKSDQRGVIQSPDF